MKSSISYVSKDNGKSLFRRILFMPYNIKFKKIFIDDEHSYKLFIS